MCISEGEGSGVDMQGDFSWKGCDALRGVEGEQGELLLFFLFTVREYQLYNKQFITLVM